MEKGATKATLSERVYENIHRDILTNQLRPGEKINIRELCQRYQASETPVRLALNRLASENIIDNFPRQGMRVKSLNISLCEETFDIRIMMECHYLRDVAMTLKVNESMRTALRANVAENLEVVQSLDCDAPLEKYLSNYQYDIAFHQLLLKCAGNQLLLDLYQHLNPFLYINYVYRKQSKERLLAGIQEHKDILDALLSGDVDKARQAMTTHLLNSKQVIISILKIDSLA
jgi:DNA-binding GntR family transcriptional regulator